ncbi:tetratricopeptide repeat protein [Desulfovibrio gilichinskyi]|uniref:NB-ARC domain-containing protein n=1 Tax=Desulfovibrio gilichinskyi TaxID=1519643 RepID=A0A1X7D5R0_9BACT|nr:tetratricopeptide repeat protein [Desulfovibrio gilichinskyi]SMF09342.1 NB-ARC domain-containing protein [Desulfovibrio gilichinskyi]
MNVSLNTDEHQNLFKSEEAWPFAIRENKVEECIDFLLSEANPTPKLLNIYGVSGSGKSFLAKEIVKKSMEKEKCGAAIYINVPPSDLDSFAILKKIKVLLNNEHKATRDAPYYVSKQIASRWRLKQNYSSSWKKSYLYRAVRDLVGLIPLGGPFLKAIMPQILPSNGNKEYSITKPIHFLLEQANSQKIILVFDNTQFIPATIIDLLEGEFESANCSFCLILIERILCKRCVNWLPNIPKLIAKEIELGRASRKEIEFLVQQILPSEFPNEEIIEAVYRRSGGNLKCVWFQLKFIYGRRLSQVQSNSPDSYEDVIQSLTPGDQTILRLVALVLGGLSIVHLTKLLAIINIHINSETILGSISDLKELGLLIINSDSNDKVKVEHEIVAHIVDKLTPEEEKMELRQQLVTAFCQILRDDLDITRNAALYDKLIGFAHEKEFRASPHMQSSIVAYIHQQHLNESFAYLVSICRDTVCWDVLDILPSYSIKEMLNAIQKCSFFSFGLIATEKLKKHHEHRQTALLFESKYLVQLFRYDEAECSLSKAIPSKEKDVVNFNIMSNLCQDEDAAKISCKIFNSLSLESSYEFDYTILRNSGHLFTPQKAYNVLIAAKDGYTRIGSLFGVATTLNNLGIVEIFRGEKEKAKKNFENSQQMLKTLRSNEEYQPLVNLAGLSFSEGEYKKARKLLLRSRNLAPCSLVMDEAMLNFNEAVISLVLGEISENVAIDIFQQIYANATKTRDLRFIEVVAWLCATVEVEFSGYSQTKYSSKMISKILQSHNVGLELLVKTKIKKNVIKVPFVLSPHWRY